MASSHDYLLPNGLRKIVFPFVPAPGGVESRGPIGATVHHQDAPARTWTIMHNLGYNPSVAIMINDQEVDADVNYPNLNTVLIVFSTPQKGSARLT
jgi:hypothetical protein